MDYGVIMDFDILNRIKEYLHEDASHLEYPRILNSIDESKFKKQECGMPEFEYEYLYQVPGGGISGDSYCGTIVFPLPNNKYMYIEYCT